jgi:plastocyanin
MNGSRTLLAGFLTALALVLWPASDASAATHQISIKSYAYGSGSMTISAGDTVTWTNKDDVPHDVVVTSGPVSFRSPMLTKGKSWSYTFGKAGHYSYTCSVHPDMNATLEVKAKAAAAPAATTPATAHAESHDEMSSPDTDAKATPTPTATTATPDESTYVATTAAAASPSLNPFLLLLGLSTAIVVFCLLLMASRPHEAVTEGEADGS